MSERGKIEAAARAVLDSFDKSDPCPWCGSQGFTDWNSAQHYDWCVGVIVHEALTAPTEREDEVERARDAMCEAILEYRRRQRDPMDFSAGACWNTVLNAIEDYASAAESARRGGKEQR